MTNHISIPAGRKLLALVDEIEKSDGLVMMQGQAINSRQLGIKKTVQVIAALRSAALPKQADPCLRPLRLQCGRLIGENGFVAKAAFRQKVKGHDPFHLHRSRRREVSQGRIWPEYWIDCSACGDREPLAETDPTRAVQEAFRRGWTKIRDKWQCPKCIEKAKAKP